MPSASAIQAAINDIRSAIAQIDPKTAGLLNRSDSAIIPVLVDLALSSILADAISGGSSGFPPSSTPILNYPILGGSSTSGTIKAGAGSVFTVEIYSSATATRFLQLFDQALTPTAGNVPVAVLPVFASGYSIKGQDAFTNQGLAFATNIYWGISTTPNTFTPPADNTATTAFVRYI